MVWNPLRLFKSIDKGLDIASEFVEDKDKRNELNALFRQLREESYQMELQTKTVPWIDGLHKMGRQLLSWATLGAGVYLLSTQPDISPASLAVVAGPGAIYNYIKGKGQ